LAPFGKGNPALVLAISGLRLVDDTALGRSEEHRRLVVEDALGNSQAVFWWHGAGRPVPQGGFDLAITLRSTEHQGKPEIQVEWQDWRERDNESVEIRTAPILEILDRRDSSGCEAILRELATTGKLQIWAEAAQPAGLESRARHQLTHSEILAIWTLPPGPRELREALEAVQPRRVLLFAHDPTLSEQQVFLQRLAGLVKHALRAKLGVLDMVELAAALADRSPTVEEGLQLLEDMGLVRIVRRTPTQWEVEEGAHPAVRTAYRGAAARLEAQLRETRAYRSYVRRAPAATVLQV
jgi:hypothetical protein